MRSIGISAKLSSLEALEAAREAAAEFTRRGVRVVLDSGTAEMLESGDAAGSPSRATLGQHCDALITFGGDGTLLSVARHAPSHVPVVGVNMGTLGFLTEIRLDEFPRLIDRLLSGNFSAEPRVTLEVFVSRDGEPTRVYRVLNDAVINKSALARMIDMNVQVAGWLLSDFRADGLIVATPTGSTAYNLSAGGPIIYPTMDALVITPICPHMLTNRPIVLPDDLDVRITLGPTSEEVYLTLDGQEGFPIGDAHAIAIRKSKDQVLLVQSPEKNYFDVLRTKLMWGSR